MATAQSDNSRTAIVYFSLSGTTEHAAQEIHRHLPGSALIRLEPREPYGDYDAAVRRGDAERHSDARPPLRSIPDLTRYTTVFIGYPIWWAQPPMIIHTFFEQAGLEGKTVVPFATSMSTPVDQSLPTIRSLAAKAGATVAGGLRWDGDERALDGWLRSLDR